MGVFKKDQSGWDQGSDGKAVGEEVGKGPIVLSLIDYRKDLTFF